MILGWKFQRNTDGSIGIFAPNPKPGESLRTSDCVAPGSGLHELLGKLVDHIAALAEPVQGPARSGFVSADERPAVGETWHILRAGATACTTLTIAEITPRTVLFEPITRGAPGERLPLHCGLRFIERVGETSAA